MISRLPRAAAVAALGCLAALAWMVPAYGIRDSLTLEMDTDPPGLLTGFYPVERDPAGMTYAWTKQQSEIELPGLDRSSEWVMTLRVRGARPDPATLPDMTFTVDGVTVETRTATNQFQNVEIRLPVRSQSRRGAAVTIAASQTFTPGPDDPRVLGLVVDRIDLRPLGTVLPPRRALASAGLAVAFLGATFGLIGLTLGTAIGSAVLIAAGQALPLTTGLGPYAPYAGVAVWIAVWIAVATVLAVQVVERWTGQPLRHTAKFAVVFSAGALYLKLLALLHPSKPLIDAVFHAHRLEWVMSGRLYFTQIMPNGVEFPYAIGLYLFAAPWTLLTHDHVTLLRIVVCASEAVAGVLLYLMIVRTWGDRLMGAVAVALFHLVPLPYLIVGNANMTNAFGQSAALITIVAATVWPLRARHFGQLIGLTTLATLAFLSHVSTVALLMAMLLAIAFFYRSLGGPALRESARSVFVATAIAFVFSMVSYYGHFGEVYRTLERVRAGAIAALTPIETPQPGGPDTAARASTAPGGYAAPLHVRTADALTYGVASIGWPIFILASVGTWQLMVGGERDRLVLVLAAWGTVYLVFLVFGVMTPVDKPFQRYAVEFIGRVNYATYPAAVILSARGGIWAWREGGVARIASVALLLYAVVGGVQQWAHWLD